MTTLTPDNLVVQGLWIGGRLSALERLCIRSFCAHGHKFHLYHYDELENVPRVDGLRLMKAEDILPRKAIFRHRSGKVSFFSDHFQWELLRRKGGWYSDMDMVCLRPLDFADEVVFGSMDYVPYLNVAIMKMPRNHFLAAAAAECYVDVNRIQPWDSTRVKWRKRRRRAMFWRDSRMRVSVDEAGSMGGLTAMVNHFGLQKHVRRCHVFHLLDMALLDYAFDNELHDMGALEPMFSRSYTVHLSNTWLGKLGIDKDGKFPHNSLYEILKRRYGETQK